MRNGPMIADKSCSSPILLSRLNILMKMAFPCSLKFCVVSAVTFLTPSSAFADTLAILQPPPGTEDVSQNTQSENNYGWIFTVGDQNLVVTGLGIWDDNGDGLGASHAVGIWDSSGTLLANANVSNGTNATLIGEFRMTSLLPEEQIFLTSGYTYTIGAFYNNADDKLHSFGAFPLFSPEIVSAEARFNFSSQLSLPGEGPGPGTSPVPYVGPNFSFIPAPECASTISLVLGSLFTLACFRRKLSVTVDPTANGR